MRIVELICHCLLIYQDTSLGIPTGLLADNFNFLNRGIQIIIFKAFKLLLLKNRRFQLRRYHPN